MMRTVSLFVVILSSLGGMWLFMHGEFYLPNRFDLSMATHFSGLPARLLGAALLCLAAAGISFMRRMAEGTRPGADRRWQVRHFVLISTSIVLFMAAFLGADLVPNPDYRPPLRDHASQ